MKKKAIVFNHAHWDIEWYMPFQSFKFWLVDAIDMLIDISQKKPEFKTYVLDGQVAPIEHYLSVKPENSAIIKGLIKDGKLTIGPFYTQFDEWLTDGEGMIRNCLNGRVAGNKYGDIMKAGYLPDNFGHPMQMPQILNGFGIDSLIFMRGMPDRPEGLGDEFYLEGLDGTRIIGVHLPNSYSNAFDIWERSALEPRTVRTAPYGETFLGYEIDIENINESDVNVVAKEMIESANRELEQHSSGIVPLAFGCDHCPPAIILPQVIDIANSIQNEIEFVQGDCQDLIDEIKKSRSDLPVFSEELYGAAFQFLLNGTLSTRTYLKQNNFECENLLVKYAEPLSEIATIFGKEYPASLLNEAWVLMFHNQAHDSIHGSSVDSVHVEMMQRYLNVAQIATGISHYSLKYLASHMDPWWGKYKAGIIVFNPTDSKNVISDVWLNIDKEKYYLQDKDGKQIPIQVIANPFNASENDSRSNYEAWPNKEARHVIFKLAQETSKIESLALVKGEVNVEEFNTNDSFIENEYIAVNFNGSNIDILDKISGKLYKDINTIQEEADAGDAWDFSKPQKECRVYNSSEFPSTCTLIEKGPVRFSLLMETKMVVPHHMELDERSTEMQPLNIKTIISINRGINRVDISVEFDNQALDHRIRLKCHTDLNCHTIKSQGHFGIISRPVVYPYNTESWKQTPDTFHFRGWVSMEEGKNGFGIACRGLYEYEPANEDGTTLYITFLRGMDRMSKNVITKRHNGTASPSIPIPQAQCTGLNKFEYSFIPYNCSEETSCGNFIDNANGFMYPGISHLVREKQIEVFDDIENPIYEIKNQGASNNIQISTFKRAVDYSGHILRLWENEGKSTEIDVQINKVFKRAFITNLNEEVTEEVIIENNCLNLNFEPYKIITILLCE